MSVSVSKAQHDLRRDISNILSLVKIIDSEISIPNEDIREMIKLCKEREMQLIAHLDTISDFIDQRNRNAHL